MQIYRVTNRVNGKVYIGKTTVTLRRRWVMHRADSKSLRYDTHFYKAIRKYGQEVFSIEAIYQARTINELNLMERFFIILHQSFLPENGYNSTLGGATLGNKHASGKRTQKQRENMSRAAKVGFAAGRVPWNKGNKKVKVYVPRNVISERQSQSQTSVWASYSPLDRAARVRKSAKGQIGRKFSDAHRKILSLASMGNRNRSGGLSVNT